MTGCGAVLVLPSPASTVSEGARPRRHALGWAFLEAKSFSDCLEEALAPTRFETVGIVRHRCLRIQEIVASCGNEAGFSFRILRLRRFCR